MVFLCVFQLSALLSVHRKEALMRDGGWNYENLVESPLRLYISGLTCRDIEVLETSDFMPVIGYYVHQRRAMNEVRALSCSCYLTGEPPGIISNVK